MAYAVKYLFKFQSSNGTVREIRVLKDGYTGAVIQRPLGRAPVIKKEQNGGVHGTSLTFYAECHVDREFIEFYTSDPKEYRVDVYAGSTLLWQGYITPELYSEPDIAPPYDVQVVATDGVGELKLYDFAPQGTVTLRSLLSYLLRYTGLSTDVNLVSTLKPGSHGAGALLDMQICVDYLEGKTCYEVLTYLLDTLHATITRWGGAWLLVRETNVTYTNDKVRYFNTTGNSALLSGSVQTLGSMRSAPAWPVGQLSMVIDPAKNKVAVQAPWHPLTCLANADMTSDFAWAKANNASYGPDGYLLPNNDTGTSSVWYAAHIEQAFTSAGLRVPMTFKLKATGVAAQFGARVYHAAIGVLITYTVGSTVYLLRRGDEGTPVWKEGSAPGAHIDGSLVDYQQPLASFDADRIQAETLNINEIPAFVQDTSYPSGMLTVYIVGVCARVYGAYLDVVLPKGYQDVLRIDNGARGEGDTVEIAIGRETAGVAYYAAFLQGLLLDNGALITSFTDANFTDGMNYLALIARDYALSVALPRASVTGKVYLENSIGMPPLVFAKGGLNYWIETWSWDLYEDELEISARTLPSASLTVQSETILESDGSTVSSASPAGSSGSGGSFPGGVNFFELDDTLVRLKGKYDYLGPRKGLIFGLNATADSKVHLEVVNVGTPANPVYALHSPLPFYSDTWISAGGVSSGGGTGGGTVVGANIGGVEVPLSDGILAFPAYPTAKSLGLGNIAFKNSLVIADVANLQSTLDEIRTLAEEGHTANEGLTIVSVTLQSLQAQIDSLANKNHFDELIASVLSADIVTAQRAYIGTIYGSLDGNAATATKLSDNTAFTAWGRTFFENGKPKNVSGALTGATTIEASTSIKIGNATISWDSKYGCLKVDKGLYSTDFISAGGKSDTEGAGSGTVTGIKIGDDDIITPINGILNIPPYPTTTSLGLKSLAFKDALSANDIPTLDISKISGLQSSLDGKQAVISDLATIREGAGLGAIAHSWGNHASAGYALASNLTAHTGNSTIHITSAERAAWNNKYDKPASGIPKSDLAQDVQTSLGFSDSAYEGLSVVSAALQSLQSQIDSVSNRKDFDEINASAVFADNLSARRVLTGEYIQIGNAVISWDDRNGCLKVDKGLYSTSFLSSAGFSDTPGTGGGTVVGATVGGVEVKLIDGILEFDAYPTTTSLGLKNLAFKDSLAVSEVVGLQSELDGKQNVISDLATIMVHADEGHTAYGYFSNGKLPYSSVSGTPTTISGYGITDALKIDGSNGTAEGVSALINKLAEGFSDPGDTDYYVCQYAGGGTTHTSYYRRPMSAMWNWIKAKTDTLYPSKTGTGASGTWGINISGNAATATKLQTPRTIWGQSFDGTGDVDGIMFMSGLDVLHIDESNLWLNYGAADSGKSLRLCGNDVAIYYGKSSNFARAMTINSSGNIGIGTTSPSAKLHVDGNILATGAVTAGQASDARLKSNIVTARNACGILRSLRGVEFDWNAIATENCKDLTGHDVGLIAQEVESLIPSAIGSIWGEYKRLDYNKITPYLVEGWKEHDDEIHKLKAKINRLEERISAF